MDGKKFKSVNDEDALPQTDEEKKAAEEKAEAGKACAGGREGGPGRRGEGGPRLLHPEVRRRAA